MKEETNVALDYPEAYADTLTDYEIERDKPMPNKVHAVIQTNLSFYLKLNYGKQFDIATELSFDTPGKPSTPDISILQKEPLDLQDDTPRETDPPLVAIEIVSPSQSYSIFKEKAARYFAFGVQSYWVVQPFYRTVHVYSNPRTYQTFINADIARDPNLDVEVPLGEVFG